MNQHKRAIIKAEEQKRLVETIVTTAWLSHSNLFPILRFLTCLGFSLSKAVFSLSQMLNVSMLK